MTYACAEGSLFGIRLRPTLHGVRLTVSGKGAGPPQAAVLLLRTRGARPGWLIPGQLQLLCCGLLQRQPALLWRRCLAPTPVLRPSALRGREAQLRRPPAALLAATQGLLTVPGILVRLLDLQLQGARPPIQGPAASQAGTMLPLQRPPLCPATRTSQSNAAGCTICTRPWHCRRQSYSATLLHPATHEKQEQPFRRSNAGSSIKS